MKKRFLAAGAVILALGIYLGNLFQGPELGQGDGEDPAVDTQVNLGADSDFTPTEPPDPASESGDGGTPAPDALTVVVQKDGYAIQEGPDETPEFDAVTLEEIVQRVNASDPDSIGVRVRLRYSQDSEMAAVEELSKRLQAPEEEGGAGLLPEEMIKVSGYVD